MSCSLTPTICLRPKRTAWVERMCGAISAWRGWMPSSVWERVARKMPSFTRRALAKQREAQAAGSSLRHLGLALPAFLQRGFTLSLLLEGEGKGSSVQSQSDRFTSTSRNSTPCSRASRTSWAGA